MITPKHVGATVTLRRDVSSDLWIVRIRPDERVSFIPGQYVTVGLRSETRLVHGASSPVPVEDRDRQIHKSCVATIADPNGSGVNAVLKSDAQLREQGGTCPSHVSLETSQLRVKETELESF